VAFTIIASSGPRTIRMMRIDILTLFPQQIDDFLQYSIIGRARKESSVEIVCTDFREFTADKHRKVDDKPFGGGPGMVLSPQPIVDAVEAVEALDDRVAKRILLSPQGQPFKQSMAKDLVACERLLLIAGHYEGFDERIRLILRPMEISIGDFVLTGGEIAAIAVVDAVLRLIPGVLGDDQSSQEETFSEGFLEYPQYTRPREYRGLEVPEILIGGHHANIEAWRYEQSVKRTQERRPDLLDLGDEK
jgi:tRNA (guanine37-N1)-methyltransferase